MSLIRLVCLGIVAMVSLATTTVHAQATPRTRIEGHLTLGWRGALGLGVDGDIPIVPQGALSGVEDDLAISPGLELFLFDVTRDDRTGGFAVVPNVGIQWNFYFAQDWSFFPELGLALWFGDRWRGGWRGDWRGDGARIGWFLYLALGMRYVFNGHNAFVLELNFPMGLQLGITF
jgi:hypothetical protein